VPMLLMFGGPLIFAIVALIVTKRARVQAPLCEHHRHHWLARSMAAGIGFVLLIPVFIGAIAMTAMSDVRGGLAETLTAPLWFTLVGLLVGWIVLLVVMQSTAVRAKEITDRELVLQGVSAEFVEAMADRDRERRERRERRRSDYDEDEEAPTPAAKAPSPTEVQDKARRKRLADEDDA
jgi:uncharacterized membrane protein